MANPIEYENISSLSLNKGYLRNDQRKEIVLKHLAEPQLSQTELAKWAQEKFHLSSPLSQGSISKILKRKNEYLMMTSKSLKSKRKSAVQNPALDTALCNWILECQSSGLNLDGPKIKQKAREISIKLNNSSDNSLEFSNGWLERFKRRHGFKKFGKVINKRKQKASENNVSCGEKDSSTKSTHLNTHGYQLLDLVHEYGESNIYKMEETRLLHCMIPSNTQGNSRINATSKDYFSILLVSSVDGMDKLCPLFIGIEDSPAEFRGRSPEALKLLYRHNSKACVTAVIFREWLQTFNDRMKIQRRRVVLIVPNSITCAYGDLELSNLKLVVLRSSIDTSKLRVYTLVAALKRRYRKIQLQRSYDLLEEGAQDIFHIDILSAMRYCIQCWDNMDKLVIQLCWKEILKINVDTDAVELRNHDEYASTIDRELQFEKAIKSAIKMLKLRNAMSFNQLIFPDIEQKEPKRHSISIDVIVEETSTNISESLTRADNSKLDNPLTVGDKLKALKLVITILREEPFRYETELDSLRSIQQQLRFLQRRETERYYQYGSW